MSAKFYSEDLGIPLDLAERVAWFMVIAKDMNPRPWVKDAMVRVYFEPWSQNKLSVFHLADKWFFDATKNEVFATGFFWGCKHEYTLRRLVSLSTTNFSGAKTKARLVEFSEVFYGKEAYRT